MTGIGDSERKPNFSPEENVSYIRFDNHSTFSTCSSIVLSSCSSDEENDDNQHVPPLRWKRQKIINTDSHHPDQPSSNNDTSTKLSVNRNSVMSAKENVVTVFDDELRSVVPPRRLPPIPEDKFHRRNPHTVRQELRMLDDLLPETTLADVHLSEMPGLQNTEQWKRIAGRTVRTSPPLSRQYYQTIIPTIELQEGQIPQPLGSYRRPGRSETEHNPLSIVTSLWRAPPCQIFFGSSIAVIIVAIVVAVVLAVTLLQKSSETTTDYYAGSVYVSAKFDQVLSDPSSTMAKNYGREFCSLVATTLADANTKYALFYSTCNVLSFRNGSIIADFILGFTRPQNVTRLSVFLNHSLVNTSLFGGTISSITFNSTIFLTKDNNTNSTDDDHDEYNYKVDSNESNKLTMNEPNSTDEQQQQPSTRTTYTTVTYTTLDKGLSITISETITITNNNTNPEKPPITNKNCELLLVPSIDTTRTVVVPNGGTNEKTLQSPSVPITTNVTTNTSSPQNLLRSIKPAHDTNFTYIDESSDDRTFSSGDAESTLEDLATRDTTTSASTPSLNDDTLTDSTSTLEENLPKQTPSKNTKESGIRTTVKPKRDSSEENRQLSSRPTPALVKRQRRMVIPKSQRRLLQYELMPTGKVYYVDRPFYNENENHQNNHDENSSVALSTILSRSSSLDTLSEKRYHSHQKNQKHYPDFHSLKKSEQKLSVGGRLASNNNLLTTTESSLFKPINTNKKKRFSSFEPTPESLDQVFDVLIEADKRREKQEFWKEKFEHRPPISRAPLINTRTAGTTNSSIIPIHRPKQIQLTSNSSITNTAARSQSYTNKRTSSYELYNQQSNCLLEDCLRRRTLLVQQQQKQQAQPQRNYSPNTIYSTTYPKQQLPPTGKSPHPLTTSTNSQPVRILPLTNGRIGRAPQARQTSDELSSISDIWATRSSLEDESRYPKKPSHHTRFQSTVNRNRLNEQKPIHDKRASSVEQQKTTRTLNKASTTTTKSKFFDLFKFNR